MRSKPSTAAGYPPLMAIAARRMCLYVATFLGDLLDDIVVVGGLVPYLIVDQAHAAEPHVGTRDLDLGLALAVLDEERYKQIAERLRHRGFTPSTNDDGKPTRQTWRLRGQDITIDFLIPATDASRKPGRLQNLEADFAAIITPALPLAFQDVVPVEIDDVTPHEERAKRTIHVAGPAAFVVLKAHALKIRGENKDAYDLVYVLRNFGDEPVTEVVGRFASIASTPDAKHALDLLEAEFASVENVGPSIHGVPRQRGRRRPTRRRVRCRSGVPAPGAPMTADPRSTRPPPLGLRCRLALSELPGPKIDQEALG